MKSGWLLSTVATSEAKAALGWPESRLAWVVRETPGAAGASGAAVTPAVTSSRAWAGAEVANPAPAKIVASPRRAAASRREGVRRRRRDARWDTRKSSIQRGFPGKVRQSHQSHQSHATLWRELQL